ncbi:MAG: DNA polymerase Y family protein [Wenzhouxiangellaceae bacterium]|nr:DNA polymerase Y family protein [Wenzhouxiangellaceae bacterium]
MQPATLWTGIVCPQAALQTLLRLLPETFAADAALAVHEVVGGRSKIIESNRLAARQGVYPGQSLADALAISPKLKSLARDQKAEARLLEEIALEAYQYSHQVAITGDGVVLEIGGSLCLHGNLDSLLDMLAGKLTEMGLIARLGTAPVAAAACLLARSQQRVQNLEELRRQLADWPLQRLALAPAELRKLESLGMKRLRDVIALPRFERDRRLGRAVNRYLDQIQGLEQTPLVYWQPPDNFRRALDLPVPTNCSQALLFALNRVLGHLHQWLRVRDRTLTRLEVELQPENGNPAVKLAAGLRQASFQRERLLEILRLKLEPLRLQSAIESLVLRADSSAGQRPPQADLWTSNNVNDAWPALLDRLRARVGDDGLCSITPCPDHRPEKAWKWSAPGTTDAGCETPPRPNWLLQQPRPCRVEHFSLIDGPERIEAGWWDGHDCRRDYWTARDRHGNKLWIFREYKPRTGWFVHGLFG